MQRITLSERETLNIEENPMAAMLYEDVEWYRDGQVVGLVARDRQDDDFYAAIFENDGHGVWRPQEVTGSIETHADALAELRAQRARLASN